MQRIWLVAIITAGIVALAICGSRIDNPKTLVYKMCQASRMGDNISEQTCGELQDYYHLEYLCKENNQLASNHCWIEQQ